MVVHLRCLVPGIPNLDFLRVRDSIIVVFVSGNLSLYATGKNPMLLLPVSRIVRGEPSSLPLY